MFINSSFGIGPEVAQIGPSIFPTTALALRLKYQPTAGLYALATVYDGVPGDPGNPRRTRILLRKEEGVFYGAEIGLTSPEDQPEARRYKLALGGWYHTREFLDFRERTHHANRGFYVLGEALLIPGRDATQGLGGFLQLGFADSDRNPIAVYLGTGLTYTGLLPGREQDVLGFAMAQARNSSAFLRTQAANTPRAETTLEWSYRAVLLPWLQLQPDVQYVMNPGTNPELANALALTLRVKMIL
ncbi:MAG: carbohydrate porin [Candidatus Tectimicrobiota bacterium]